jgi:hypothetical protein
VSRIANKVRKTELLDLKRLASARNY